MCDGLAVYWMYEFKTDKLMFLRAINFLPSDLGCFAKFKASVQPSYSAVICFPPDDAEDISENYERCC